jgi:glycosyltransferase involved in cell wall biosynthesis
MLNWNRKHYSQQTLEKIIARTTIPHELILVDNGSKDGTREYLKSMENKTNAKKVTYVFNDKNLGVAGGRNSGLAVASGDYLVTIDDDIVVPEKWDICMAEACDNIPKLGITGVNVEPFKFPVQTINGVRVRPKTGNLGGGCLCLPRRVFKTVGYYNYFSTYGHEDCAMYYRLVQIGLMSAYIVPKGVHLDKDADKAYRKAKNDAHKKSSLQLRALSAYLANMRKTGNVYASFDPNFDPTDIDIFTSDLILSERKK